jgi:hypothetical protein
MKHYHFPLFEQSGQSFPNRAKHGFVTVEQVCQCGAVRDVEIQNNERFKFGFWVKQNIENEEQNDFLT